MYSGRAILLASAKKDSFRRRVYEEVLYNPRLRLSDDVRNVSCAGLMKTSILRRRLMGVPSILSAKSNNNNVNHWNDERRQHEQRRLQWTGRESGGRSRQGRHDVVAGHMRYFSTELEPMEHDNDEELDEEILQLAAASIEWGDEDMRRRMEGQQMTSSLDLELGEVNVWDDEFDALSEWDMENVTPRAPPHDRLTTFSPRKPQQQLQNGAHSMVVSPLDILQELHENGGVDPDSAPVIGNTSYLADFETDDLEEMQIRIECESQHEQVKKYQKIVDQARQRKEYGSLSTIQRHLVDWIKPIRDEIERLQDDYINFSSKSGGVKARRKYGPLLCTVDADKLAVIVTHEALLLTISHSSTGCKMFRITDAIGTAVEDEVMIQRALRKHMEEERAKKQPVPEGFEPPHLDETSEHHDLSVDGGVKIHDENSSAANHEDDNDLIQNLIAQRFSYVESRLHDYMNKSGVGSGKNRGQRTVKESIKAMRRKLKTDDWTKSDRIHVGSILLRVLIENAYTTLPDRTKEPAFRIERRWTEQKGFNFVVMNDNLLQLGVTDEVASIAAVTRRHKPMVIPPRPWNDPDDGGYMWLKTELVRFHGSRLQRECLDHADLSTVYDGLNALARQPWRINKKLLKVAQECWQRNIALGDIPTQTDFEVPPAPARPVRRRGQMKGNDEEESLLRPMMDPEDYRRYLIANQKHRRAKQKNADLVSLRCSAILKLRQAEKFQDFDELYFPYNMDFRGRAYPVPPHLSNIGSDLCRGLLTFSNAKPLGKRGLYWLKVHLANLAGQDKMSFDGRAQYVEDNLEKVREAVEDPFGGDLWWTHFDYPFQGLATCHEIINAIDSGDPESYKSSLPVHMDGSCNGLQHYAALGRDRDGGKVVNLCNEDKPQDVYIGVMHEVIRRVANDAEEVLDFDTNNMEALSKQQKRKYYDSLAAKGVNGLIDRGVVKRTVMTSVYGVTFIGARDQIKEKIEEKLEQKGHDLDELDFDLQHACGYLARVTMNVIGDLFTGAKQTMNWLTDCSRLISAKGYPVAWITPVGLPCIQPYRRVRVSRICTALHKVNLHVDDDDLPLHRTRSVSAFPPNFIHSLDSSHMLLTAIEMDRRGLSFSAVHDSFWTHPSDIDEMNEALREVFVQLYEQPLLEQTKASWEIRYPDIEFPEVPKRGVFDLREVKDATYFFQ